MMAIHCLSKKEEDGHPLLLHNNGEDGHPSLSNDGESFSRKRREGRGRTNGREDGHPLPLENLSRGLPHPASLEGRRLEKGREIEEI